MSFGPVLVVLGFDMPAKESRASKEFFVGIVVDVDVAAGAVVVEVSGWTRSGWRSSNAERLPLASL